jgi:hypothetical protein
MMNSLQLAQLTTALVVAATPWIVVRVACEVASLHAGAVQQRFEPPHTVRPLLHATLAAILVAGAAAVWLPAPSRWMVAVDILMFLLLAALALRALGEIERVSLPAREVASTKRMAPLTPRRIGDYLPWSRRMLAPGVALIGLALLVARLTDAPAGRRALAPIGFALAALVFLWLYEVWLRQLVTGPFVPNVTELEPLRRRLVHLVFYIELALVTVLLGAAHALLDLDWTIYGVWAAGITLTAALAGVVGCAFAVSSELAYRRYTPAA